MRSIVFLVIATVISGGTACAQTSEQLIDAMVFVAKGEEDGMPIERSTLVRKTFKNGRYEYTTEGFEDTLVTYATSSQPCVFKMGTIFIGREVDPEVFDLSKATKFELISYFNDNLGHFGSVVLEGGDSYCLNGKCTYHHLMPVMNVNDKPRPKQLEVLARYEKAIGFLKKQCPGKPY